MAALIRVGSALSLEDIGGYLSGELKLKRFASIIKDKGAKVLVEINPVYEDPDDPKCPPELADEVKAGIEWLLANEEAASAAVVQALRDGYPKLATNLGAHVDLRGVTFHELTALGFPYLGFELGCSWDDEHGVGLMMHGTRLVELGGADTAILEWIAEGDARKLGAEPEPVATKAKPAPKKAKPAAKKAKPAAKKAKPAAKPRKAAPKPRKAAPKPRKAAPKPRKAAPKPRKAARPRKR